MPRPREQSKTYLRFVMQPERKGRKTAVWDVVTLENPVDLGEIRWHPGWRRYAFFPLEGTLYESKCLRDLADWCERQTANRKDERRRERLAETDAQAMPESWRAGRHIPDCHR